MRIEDVRIGKLVKLDGTGTARDGMLATVHRVVGAIGVVELNEFEGMYEPARLTPCVLAIDVPIVPAVPIKVGQWGLMRYGWYTRSPFAKFGNQHRKTVTAKMYGNTYQSWSESGEPFSGMISFSDIIAVYDHDPSIDGDYMARTWDQMFSPPKAEAFEKGKCGEVPGGCDACDQSPLVSMVIEGCGNPECCPVCDDPEDVSTIRVGIRRNGIEAVTGGLSFRTDENNQVRSSGKIVINYEAKSLEDIREFNSLLARVANQFEQFEKSLGVRK